MSDIPRRPFGRKGEDELSIIGIGGGHIGRDILQPDEAVRMMHRAIDEGINFFDNAWEYNERESERRMGIAIEDRRDDVFLMTKVCSRDKKGALTQLDESLELLRTDRLDLWMFHEVNYGNDPDWIFGPGGAIEAADAALKSGKVRHVGFTGHKDPNYLLRMMEFSYEFSGLLMPTNVMDPSFHRSFIREVLPVAKEKGISVLGMKSLGGFGQIVEGGGCPVEDALRFAMSQDITSLVSGMDSMAVLEQNIAIAKGFESMSQAEQDALIAKYQKYGGDGRFEGFKTTQYYDSRVHRDQHGFPEVESLN